MQGKSYMNNPVLENSNQCYLLRFKNRISTQILNTKKMKSAVAFLAILFVITVSVLTCIYKLYYVLKQIFNLSFLLGWIPNSRPETFRAEEIRFPYTCYIHYI